MDECPDKVDSDYEKKSSFLLDYSKNGMRFLVLQVVSRIEK